MLVAAVPLLVLPEVLPTLRALMEDQLCQGSFPAACLKEFLGYASATGMDAQSATTLSLLSNTSEPRPCLSKGTTITSQEICPGDLPLACATYELLSSRDAAVPLA